MPGVLQCNFAGASAADQQCEKLCHSPPMNEIATAPRARTREAAGGAAAACHGTQRLALLSAAATFTRAKPATFTRAKRLLRRCGAECWRVAEWRRHDWHDDGSRAATCVAGTAEAARPQPCVPPRRLLRARAQTQKATRDGTPVAACAHCGAPAACLALRHTRPSSLWAPCTGAPTARPRGIAGRRGPHAWRRPRTAHTPRRSCCRAPAAHWPTLAPTRRPGRATARGAAAAATAHALECPPRRAETRGATRKIDCRCAPWAWRARQ